MLEFLILLRAIKLLTRINIFWTSDNSIYHGKLKFLRVIEYSSIGVVTYKETKRRELKIHLM